MAGDTGLQGETGDIGQPGATGEDGQPGVPGRTGPQGPQGESGDDGPAVSKNNTLIVTWWDAIPLHSGSTRRRGSTWPYWATRRTCKEYILCMTHVPM